MTRAAGRLYQVLEVKPNVFVWDPEDVIESVGDPEYERAGNAAFVITSDGVVIVNATNSPFHAREMLYEIRQRTSQPVRYLIDTGSAGDETLGNEVFADLEAPILSTPGIQQEVEGLQHAFVQRSAGDDRFQRRIRGIHVKPPNETFQGEKQLVVGGQTFRLISFEPGLRAMAVDVPSARVAFLGDLFQNHFIPHLEARDIHQWIQALREAEAWDVDIYVPGHGEPAGRKEVGEFRQFLEWLANEVQARVTEGKSLAETQAELVPFKSEDWHATELEPELVAGLYEQLARSAKARAPGH